LVRGTRQGNGIVKEKKPLKVVEKEDVPEEQLMKEKDKTFRRNRKIFCL